MKNILVILFVLICYVQSKVVIGEGVEDLLAKQGTADLIIGLEVLDFDNIANNFVETSSVLQTNDMVEEMIKQLKKDSEEKQAPLLNKLVGNSLSMNNCRKYYVANALACDKVTKEQFEQIKKTPKVKEVILNKLDGKSQLKGNTAPIKVLPQHITAISADKLWKKGRTKGKGIVIGIASSGVNVQHEALKSSYRGTNKDGTFNHNYNWFDAYGGSPSTPKDSIFVGTHITGVAAGTKNSIGVAPESKFIHCKAIDDLGRDAPEPYLKCLQWFLAPTDTNGNNADCRKRPHAVYIPYSGSTGGELFLAPIGVLRAAGIYVISQVSPTDAGNVYCARQIRAPTFYPNVLSVGGLNLNNLRLSTSTGGPLFYPNGTIDPTRIKPDVAAPGEAIVSSVWANGQSTYLAASGSVISGNVVLGAVALLWGANSRLRRSIALTDEILKKSATPIKSLECSSQRNYPNNLYGYGRVDILNAHVSAPRIANDLCRLCRNIKPRRDHIECKKNYCLRFPCRRNHWRWTNVEEVEEVANSEEFDNTLEEIIETYE